MVSTGNKDTKLEIISHSEDFLFKYFLQRGLYKFILNAI